MKPHYGESDSRAKPDNCSIVVRSTYCDRTFPDYTTNNPSAMKRSHSVIRSTRMYDRNDSNDCLLDLL
jgi:hypothetical protein